MNENETAFPMTWQDQPEGVIYSSGGLTKLEWFAGQALAGGAAKTSETAFDIAEFMLKEAEKRQK